MTRDEAFSELESITLSGSAFFVLEREGFRFGGPCQITMLSRDLVTVLRSGGYSSFSWPLNVDGVTFESKSAASLPDDERKHVPLSAKMAFGLLMTAPNGETLFLMAGR
jgi:hypothetical protein